MKTERHTLGVKAAIAGVAAPRLAAHQGESEIQRAVAVRPKAIGAATLRADHFNGSPEIPAAEYRKLRAGASLRISRARPWPV
jgi:hypothetical protein